MASKGYVKRLCTVALSYGACHSRNEESRESFSCTSGIWFQACYELLYLWPRQGALDVIRSSPAFFQSTGMRVFVSCQAPGFRAGACWRWNALCNEYEGAGGDMHAWLLVQLLA
jgi:hypothetical protein